MWNYKKYCKGTLFDKYRNDKRIKKALNFNQKNKEDYDIMNKVELIKLFWNETSDAIIML